jgi:hypothetical protein
VTKCADQQILIGVIRLTLRDRPVALVPAREERAAWVTEQDLRLAGRDRTAKEEYPGALPRSHRRIVRQHRCHSASTSLARPTRRTDAHESGALTEEGEARHAAARGAIRAMEHEFLEALEPIERTRPRQTLAKLLGEWQVESDDLDHGLE